MKKGRIGGQGIRLTAPRSGFPFGCHGRWIPWWLHCGGGGKTIVEVDGISHCARLGEGVEDLQEQFVALFADDFGSLGGHWIER